jgi:hypothetical protein
MMINDIKYNTCLNKDIEGIILKYFNEEELIECDGNCGFEDFEIEECEGCDLKCCEDCSCECEYCDNCENKYHVDYFSGLKNMYGDFEVYCNTCINEGKLDFMLKGEKYNKYRETGTKFIECNNYMENIYSEYGNNNYFKEDRLLECVERNEECDCNCYEDVDEYDIEEILEEGDEDDKEKLKIYNKFKNNIIEDFDGEYICEECNEEHELFKECCRCENTFNRNEVDLYYINDINENELIICENCCDFNITYM